jgi:hypothetical protein
MPFGRARLCRAENGRIPPARQSLALPRVFEWPHLGVAVGIGDIPGTGVLPGKAGLGVPGRLGLVVPGKLGMLPLGRLGLVLPGTLGGLLPGTRGGLGTLGGLLPGARGGLGTRGGLFPGTLGLLGLVCATRTENATRHVAMMPKYFICFIRSLS